MARCQPDGLLVCSCVVKNERVPSSLIWINGATLNYITLVSEKLGKCWTILHHHIDLQFWNAHIVFNRKKYILLNMQRVFISSFKKWPGSWCFILRIAGRCYRFPEVQTDTDWMMYLNRLDDSTVYSYTRDKVKLQHPSRTPSLCTKHDQGQNLPTAGSDTWEAISWH